MKYRQEGVPLLVLAGVEYGAGSSRDWAAKGAALLGVRAVIAETFERIHRSNLVGMGILPLQFLPGENAESLGLTGGEEYEILDLAQGLRPGGSVRVRANLDDRPRIEFQARVRVDTPNEVGNYRNGGILHRVVREMVKDRSQSVDRLTG
jgi:aconitate hydratase